MIKLFEYQREVIEKLKNGSILWGGVGSGKSIASLGYYIYSCSGILISKSSDSKKAKKLKPLYIITTANKRDSGEWEQDYKALFLNPENLIVDSWNNIEKYKDIEGAFFIFDEQKVIGNGSWSKQFIKITKSNDWILATATPGDVWMDYVPVFIANGFFRNRTEFNQNHVVYSPYSKYPKIERYENVGILEFFKKQVLVEMKYENSINISVENVDVSFDMDAYQKATKTRWNPFTDEPIKQISELYYVWRRIVNSDEDRINKLRVIFEKHSRIIVFYNFNYELEKLRTLADIFGCPVKEYNGFNHDSLPEGERWIYLVQYIAGAEAWNCITTNVVVYYSLNYSYKLTSQAGGRIDRTNTPFSKLYYYYLVSRSPIDSSISGSLIKKEDFNEKKSTLKIALA
jgi:hypothetical protein